MDEQTSKGLGDAEDEAVSVVFKEAFSAFTNTELPVEDRLSGAVTVISFMSGAIAELRGMLGDLASSTMVSLVLASRSEEEANSISGLVTDYMEKVERNREILPTAWVYSTIASRLEKKPT